MAEDLWGLDPSSQRVALDVLRHGPISRAELGRALGLSSGSLTRITKPMIASGLLVQGDPVAAPAGRPSLPLDVAAESAFFVGTKLVVGRLYAVLTDLKGVVRERVALDADLGTPAAAVDALASVVDGLRAGGWPLHGIGISLAASVDADGMVRGASLLGWGPSPLAAMVSERTMLPVVVDNDVNAFTLAEHWFGFGRGCREFAALTIGAGVGLGLVCNDLLVTGHRGAAGMIGYARLADGREARDVVESDNVAARVSAALGREVTYRDLAGLDGPDPRVLEVLDDVADAVGQLAGLVALVTSPQRLLVSGEGATVLTPHLGRLRAALDRFGLGYVPLPALKLADVGFGEWARGSAALAIRRHMTDAL